MQHIPLAELRKDSYRKVVLIIQTATEMFIELGFEKASMNLLAKRSGCSKSTLYKHFNDKEALFVAVVDELLKGHLQPVQELELTDTHLEEGLIQIARAGMSVITSRKAVNIFRIVVAEVERIPIVGRIYFEHGPRLAIGGIKSYLQHQVETGKISCASPGLAAEYFWGMLLHKIMLELYCGIDRPMSKAATTRYVNKVVKDFIDAFIER